MSTTGLELLTRNSLSSGRHSTDRMTRLRTSFGATLLDERAWSWTFLRHQFQLKNLDELFVQYQQRLHNGYFSVLLLLQIVLFVTHSVVLAVYGNMNVVWPDAASYCIVALIFMPMAVTMRRRNETSAVWVPSFISCIAVIVLVLADLIPTMLHYYLPEPPRPAYATYTLLVVYVFLPLVNNLQTVLLGLVVSACHISVLGFITYRRSYQDIYNRLASDLFYFGCVNIMGIYFRLLNEVATRRTFLDRRANIETTFKLEFEKQQEEHLMISILPRHIVEDVKADIKKIFQHILVNQAPLKKKPFSNMYVKEHHNVSILYADVVNYASLTASLPVTKLVETLNELFRRFDEASEKRSVLRIKFLGDCYYCVSGVPNANPQHAKNCVELGLDMIAIIREVREESMLRQHLNMRIGVHSGRILSGLLGVCKWQYDIWSQDVIIANIMEQSGKPGMIHITQQTYNYLGTEYICRPANGSQHNSLLAKYNINTYFIVPEDQHSDGGEHSDSRSLFSRRSSISPRRHTSRSIRRNTNDGTSRRRTAFMDNNLHQYQQALLKANEAMAMAIQSMHLGLYDRWFHSGHINPLCLSFKNWNWELPFTKQPDPLFKFYVLCSMMVLLCMLIIHTISNARVHWLPWTGYGSAMIFLFILQPVNWTHFLWNWLWDPHGDEGPVAAPTNIILKKLYSISFNLSKNTYARISIYLAVIFSLTLCLALDFVDCYFHSENTTECLTSWEFNHICSIVQIMNFFFLRIHFLLKLSIGCIITSAYCSVVWILEPHIFNEESWNEDLKPQIAHIMSIVFLTLTLHFIDRQSEYMNRLDYKWKLQLSEEQEESATTRMINKMLLENILPTHVAELYLNTDRTSDELYHEEYESVAVMFASLTEYTLFDADNPESNNELRSLKLLNEIICDFDKLLFEPNFLRVEKIKVAGWTYMAACGLDRGRRDSSTSANRKHYTEHVVVVLARFAASMMVALEKINREALQTFKLRIGISHGPITAGVIGSQKPLYDIWGDAVNMASRMDSTGAAGKIQATENTAQILEEEGIACCYRGPTFVKGKGYMTTYFLKMEENFQLVVKQTRNQLFPEIKRETNINSHNKAYKNGIINNNSAFVPQTKENVDIITQVRTKIISDKEEYNTKL